MNLELIQLEDTEAEKAAKAAKKRSTLAPTVSKPADTSLRGRIVKAIRTVYDPEIPVNVYDLGLIYGIDIADADDAKTEEDESQDCNVVIQMTLTAPGCPVADMLVAEVEARAREVDGVGKALVELVWDPPWTDELMSEAAKLELNL